MNDSLEVRARVQSTPKQLAYAALDRIDADPSSWNQAMWATRNDCGAAFCYAGHVVNVDYGAAAVPMFVEGERESVTGLVQVEGKQTDYRTVAARLLNLDYNSAECSRLFSPASSLTGLRQFVAKIFGPREEVADGAGGA